MPSDSIYIISTIENAENNKYKIGKHSGTQKKLLCRYSTPLIDPIIYYFRPVENATNIEKKIKSALKEHRVKNKDGHLTEWVEMVLIDIICKISEICGDEKDNSQLRKAIEVIRKMDEIEKENKANLDRATECLEKLLGYCKEYKEEIKTLKTQINNTDNDDSSEDSDLCDDSDCSDNSELELNTRQKNLYKKVLKLYNNGTKLENACKEVGICKQSYFTYRSKYLADKKIKKLQNMKNNDKM